MPTAIAQSNTHTQARNFALRGVAWSLALFGVIRLGWFEVHAILPVTQLQAHIAQLAFGPPAGPIVITLACSGADALALCLGAVLAYPVSWRSRTGGAAGGLVLILALNTIRIGTLGRIAASPSWFERFHLYGWPALLALAIPAYVFAWMWRSDRHLVSPDRPSLPPQRASLAPAPLMLRFGVLALVCVALFSLASPLYFESPAIVAVGGFVARAAAIILAFFGIQTTAAANVLVTSRGGFAVTPECLLTPLIPVYIAAVVALVARWRARALALLATGPLFVALGIARLLVVALPATIVGSPLLLVHSFFQLLLGLVVIGAAAVWRHGPGLTASQRALAATLLGAAVAYAIAPLDASAMAAAFASAPLEDPQGAIALLPSFQVGIYVALFVAASLAVEWRSFVAGLGVVVGSQLVIFMVLRVLAERGLTPHVRDVRAWSLAGPMLVIAAMVKVKHGRPAR